MSGTFAIQRPENNYSLKVMSIPIVPSIAQSLLVSRSSSTIVAVCASMQRFAVNTKVCRDVPSARHLLNTRKFDAVVLDLDLHNECPFLIPEMRKSPSNGASPAIAISRTESTRALAFLTGANFILPKPLSDKALIATIVGSYGLMLRERRRYFRCTAGTRGIVRRSGMPQLRCRVLNVSEGGMKIVSAAARLGRGMAVHVEFTLPGSMATFTALCETRWRDWRGRAGLRFVSMPIEQRCDLQEWLAANLEHSLPPSIADRVRDFLDRPGSSRTN